MGGGPEAGLPSPAAQSPIHWGGHLCRFSKFPFNRKLLSSALCVLQGDPHGSTEGPGGDDPPNRETARGPLGLRASAVTEQEVFMINLHLPACKSGGTSRGPHSLAGFQRG